MHFIWTEHGWKKETQWNVTSPFCYDRYSMPAVYFGFHCERCKYHLWLGSFSNGQKFHQVEMNNHCKFQCCVAHHKVHRTVALFIQIAGLKLNFYEKAADSVSLHVITMKKRIYLLKQSSWNLFFLNHVRQQHLQRNKKVNR